MNKARSNPGLKRSAPENSDPLAEAIMADLARIMPVMIDDRPCAGPICRKHVHELLLRILKQERRRAARGCWTYDISRHRRLTRLLARLSRDDQTRGPTPIPATNR